MGMWIRVACTFLFGAFVIWLADGPQWAQILGGWVLVLISQVERR